MAVRSAIGRDRSGAAESGERRALQLLVVNDDATQRTLIAHATKLAGHGASFAGTCSEAIAEIQNRRFDCVTVDLMLEDGGGTEVLKVIADAKFAGAVIGGMDASRRIAARSYARSLGHRPAESAEAGGLANLTAMGLPVVHTWGGVAADGVAQRHRP